MNGSKSVRNLTQGKISSQILFFAIPVIIGNLLQELYNVVDTLIVGQTLGEIKLAAVGSTSSLNFFALGFFIGLSAGCSVITSQHFGANDMERVKKSVAAHIIIGVVSAVVLTVSFVLLVNPLLTMLGTTSDTFEYASRYLTIIYLGIPATMLYNLTASLLRSVGDSKTPLYLLLFSSVMNVGLDLLFIIVFRWDVSGAAIATVISQLVSAVLCCVYIFFKVKMLLPNRNSFKNLTSTVRAKSRFPDGTSKLSNFNRNDGFAVFRKSVRFICRCRLHNRQPCSAPHPESDELNEYSYRNICRSERGRRKI